jgi:hypothetical protein
VTGEAEAPVEGPVEEEPLLYDEPAGPELPPEMAGLYDELVGSQPEPAPVERSAMKAEGQRRVAQVLTEDIGGRLADMLAELVESESE